MNQLIENIKEWGISRGITGSQGKGTIDGQHKKTLEEVQELTDGLRKRKRAEIKDAIGDIVVTLILQAELQGMDFQDCVQSAYDIINKRKGKMVNGIFVKDKPSDDDLGELDATKACNLGDTACESCS